MGKEKNNNKKTDKNRSLAFNVVSSITIAVVIAVTVVFNIVFASLFTAQIDLTETKEFSISSEAEDLLKRVSKEVEIVGLFDEIKKDRGGVSSGINYLTDIYIEGGLSEGTALNKQYLGTYGAYLPETVNLGNLNISSVMGMLSQMTNINKNIKVKYVDPEANPLYLKNLIGETLANDFAKGDFLVKCGDVVKKVTSADLCRKIFVAPGYGEKLYLPYAPNVDGGFLSAIYYVTADKRPVVGVVTNHSELDIEQYFPLLKSTLEENVFVIQQMDLAIEDIKDKYDIIMLLNPLTDITVGESDKLKNYLSTGGNLVVCANASDKSLEYTNLNGVLSHYNLKINNDIVNGGADEVINGTLYLPVTASEILSKKVELPGANLLLPNARSITYLQAVQGELKSNILLQTGKSATTTDYSLNAETAKGVKCVGAVSAYTENSGSKVLVLGSATMLSDYNNYSQTAGYAVEMVVKVCTWMEQSVNYEIPVKADTMEILNVTQSSATLVGWITILLLPLLTLAVGIFIWLRRRHL